MCLMTAEQMHSGFACVVGRPNVGKSTLVNALVGQKIAITSARPQTTRHVIRGVVHRPDAQLVLVDTPGLHKPRTLLGKRLNDRVREAWAQVDVMVQCFPADQKPGPGDRLIAKESAAANRGRRVAVVTKTDLAAPQRIGEQLLAVAALGQELERDWDEIVPVSAVSGERLDTLADVLLAKLPEGPALYPDGVITEEPEQSLVSEIIREVALQGMSDELPHSIAVVVEEMEPREDRPADDPLVDVIAWVFVERDSQKAIVVGRKGEGIRRIGTESRKRIEALLGTRVFLDLRVKIAKDWQRDPKQMNRLGF
ncbi:MAG: GTPase Era [Actinomycetia bacterium]|nr:GTPase Era [Actinomycetes bacterium]MCH9801867.1 GTPase Era [Actinomycetes bacterium]